MVFSNTLSFFRALFTYLRSIYTAVCACVPAHPNGAKMLEEACPSAQFAGKAATHPTFPFITGEVEQKQVTRRYVGRLSV